MQQEIYRDSVTKPEGISTFVCMNHVKFRIKSSTLPSR